MPIPVHMPALSPTMEEGTLAKWLVKEGDSVESGDIIAEIETDKATMEVDIADDGTVGKLVVSEGTEGVPVGEVIAVLLEEGEDKSALGDMDLDKMSAAKESGGKDDKEEKPEEGKKPKQAKNEGKKEKSAPVKAEKGGKAPPAPERDGERVFASPLARRLAEQEGIDLTALKGSGPHGRIVKSDIEKAVEESAARAGKEKEKPEPEKASRPPAEAPEDVDYEEEKVSSFRKTIAKRLMESKQTIPHYYLTVDVEIDKLLSIRKEINDGLSDTKVSVNDFVIRAAALAFRRVPEANVQWAGDKILRFKQADISVAVDTDKGLITPVIRKADQKGLETIAAEMKDLAEKAREGSLKPEEYQGGTFSVSNLGMFGIREFAAVINPPQSGILAIGKGEERPVVKDGALTKATVMTVTLSADHRVLDGALGARYLTAFKGLLENPLTMML